MNYSHEIAVIGLGAMGSAAAYYLSNSNLSILGVDQFSPPHDRGSTHGETRLIRTAYFEHPCYVPILQRAVSEWTQLSKQAIAPLFYQSGLMIAGNPSSSSVVSGTLESAAKYDLPVERLDHDELSSRMPLMEFRKDHVGVFEESAGYLRPEKAIEYFLTHASDNGVDLQTNTQLVSYEIEKNGVRLVTSTGTFFVKKVVWTCGAWSGNFVQPWKNDLTIYRMVLNWYGVRPEKLSQFEAMHCFGVDQGGRFIYGFPSIDQRTMKMADHSPENTIKTPDRYDRTIHDSETVHTDRFAVDVFGESLTGRVRSETCLYTMSDDEHFYIDQHPDSQNMIVACGFSGHGYKFACIVGQELAGWATGRPLSSDFQFFQKAHRLKK